ncbi:hypothetical protein MRY82_05915 [bacterium]|nr:hypothetical protein [bacterium]
MQSTRYSGGKNTKKNSSKTDKFSNLIQLTQSMTNGLSANVEKQVYQSIDEVGRVKKLSEAELKNLKTAVKIRAQKSKALLGSRLEYSLKQASGQLSKALSKEINSVEKTLNRIEKKLNKLEKNTWA